MLFFGLMRFACHDSGARVPAPDGQRQAGPALAAAAGRLPARTYENSQIRMVDLMKMNLDAKDIVTMSIKGEEVIKPLIP